ncbi:MAG: chromate transporter [Blastocatellia bacterium]|nr:chromate transporter [Blastocatellia bacterium]
MREVSERSYISELKVVSVTYLKQLKEWLADQYSPETASVNCRALARAFLWLGATGFGGGVAVIGQVRRLVVRRRHWLSDEEFLDAVSLAHSLPGADAANAVSYVGLKLGGIRGAVVSLVSFILPSFLFMIALTIAHNYLHHLPDAQRVFQGFNAAVVGLIAAITLRLGKTAVQQQWHLELGVAAAFILIFTQTTVVEVVLVAGMIGVFINTFKTRVRHHVRQRLRKERQDTVRTRVAEKQARQSAAELMDNPDETSSYKVEVSRSEKGSVEKKRPDEEEGSEQKKSHRADRATGKLLSFAPVVLLLYLSLPVLSKLITVWQLTTIFLRVGTVTFGGGFVMIPQIETDIVDMNRWMDRQTFADGMAFGQITPGPVLITATFIGYKVAGTIGAVAATVAAFLPSFIMTVIAGASINRFRTNFFFQSFLAGVAPAVVGLLAAAGVSLAKNGLNTSLSYGVATLAFLLMLRAKLNPVVIIVICGLLQWAVSRGLIGWLKL